MKSLRSLGRSLGAELGLQTGVVRPGETGFLALDPEAAENYPAHQIAGELLQQFDAFDDEMLTAMQHVYDGLRQPTAIEAPEPAAAKFMSRFVTDAAINLAPTAEASPQEVQSLVVYIKDLCVQGGMANQKRIQDANPAGTAHYQRVRQETQQFVQGARIIHYLNTVNAGMIFDDMIQGEPGALSIQFQDRDNYPIWHGFYNATLDEYGTIFASITGNKDLAKHLNIRKVVLPGVLRSPGEGTYWPFDTYEQNSMRRMLPQYIPWIEK